MVWTVKTVLILRIGIPWKQKKYFIFDVKNYKNILLTSTYSCYYIRKLKRKFQHFLHFEYRCKFRAHACKTRGIENETFWCIFPPLFEYKFKNVHAGKIPESMELPLEAIYHIKNLGPLEKPEDIKRHEQTRK